MAKPIRLEPGPPFRAVWRPRKINPDIPRLAKRLAKRDLLDDEF
ncbi:MAG: hypothetical protein OXS32_05450 [Verrucomicrobiales bacterium]|nr:hypothetical protein [Verrucomicrobiales bacterium]